MHIVAYVTGHGLGHTVREVTILQHLPESVRLTIKSSVAERFWRQELKRPFDLVNEDFDVGCLQTTSLDTDVPATLAAWLEMDARNKDRVDSEAEYLRRAEADLVLTDIPPFPLTVAAKVGIPSVCVVNFTWVDIYAEFAEAEPAFRPIVARLTEEYAQATVALDTDLSLPLAYFPRKEPMGLVARVGKDRRPELLSCLPASAESKRIALLYVGNWGLPLAWEKLPMFTNWHFVTLAPLDLDAPNLTVLAQHDFPHADIVASVDLVISKLGYGMVGECLAAGTPMLYAPRNGFAEYVALDAALRSRSESTLLSREAFLSLDWADALSRIPARGTIPPVPAPGGEAIAKWLATAYR